MRKRRSTAMVLSLALALLVWSPGSPASAAGCDRAWRIVEHPERFAGMFRAAVAISDTDVWAVGSQYVPRQTLTEHWDGSRWHRVNSRNRTGSGNTLYGVDAAGPGDVWAVGDYYTPASGIFRALVEHWDGRAWTLVKVPTPGGQSHLYGVFARAADDVWAVGNYSTRERELTLAEHWDGTAWTVVPTPSPARASFVRLNSVDGSGPDDVWAVGVVHGGRSLIMHWDGTAWTRVRSPNDPSPEVDDGFTSVDVLSPTQAWAIGASSSGTDIGTPAAHWNGSRWRPIDTVHDAHMVALAALSPHDVWAAGDWDSEQAVGPQTRVEHWDGSRWRVARSQNVNEQQHELMGLAVTPSGNGWAVGWHLASSGSTLILHACGL